MGKNIQCLSVNKNYLPSHNLWYTPSDPLESLANIVIIFVN